MPEAPKDPYPKRKIEDPPQKKRWSLEGTTIEDPYDWRQRQDANSKELPPIITDPEKPKVNFKK